MKTKEELLISENFVRLDVKRLRDLLYRRADEVYFAHLNSSQHTSTQYITTYSNTNIYTNTTTQFSQSNNLLINI